MATNDGGPAFPVDGFPGDNFFPQVKPHKGMTLRDYFAGQALAGVMVASPEGGWCGWAHDAYKLADAMLAARGGGAK